MSDEVVYDSIIDTTKEMVPFFSKEIATIYDQQNGSYTNQIEFDTNELQTSGLYVNWSEAILEIPYIISLQSSVDISANMNAFAISIKNGWYNIIDSITGTFGNTTVINQTNLVNVHTNFKLLTSMGQNDLKKWGPSLGFNPDSVGSFVNNLPQVSGGSGASGNGDGYTNNRDYGGTFTYASLENYNEGFLKRKRITTAYDASASGNNNQVACNAQAKNYYFTYGNGAARIYSWFAVAQIKLAHLSDFFTKMPPTRGGRLQLTLNFNAFNSTITNTYAAGPPATNTLTIQSVIAYSGNTNPVLLSSSLANQGGNGLITAASSTLSVSSGIKTNSLIGSNSPNVLSNCRIQIPTYSMVPEYEARLANISTEKEFRYIDLQRTQFTATSGSQFTQSLNTNLVRPRYVLLVPFRNPGTAGQVNALFANVNVPEYQSCFDTAPSTTAPSAFINTWNVQLDNRNVYRKDIKYDYETFLDEVSRINAINGGAVVSQGLTSGLIGQYEWDNGYRYLVCDLSRNLPEDDNSTHSLSVSGTNNSGYSIDFQVFIACERVAKVDLFSGKLLSLA